MPKHTAISNLLVQNFPPLFLFALLSNYYVILPKQQIEICRYILRQYLYFQLTKLFFLVLMPFFSDNIFAANCLNKNNY